MVRKIGMKARREVSYQCHQYEQHAIRYKSRRSMSELGHKANRRDLEGTGLCDATDHPTKFIFRRPKHPEKPEYFLALHDIPSDIQ